jgi:hypothetical protein
MIFGKLYGEEKDKKVYFTAMYPNYYLRQKFGLHANTTIYAAVQSTRITQQTSYLTDNMKGHFPCGRNIQRRARYRQCSETGR